MWSPTHEWSEQSVLTVAMAMIHSMFELKDYPTRTTYIIIRHIESKDRCIY